MYAGQEVGGELVVAGCEPSEVLEAAEHALDGVPALVKHGAEAAFPASGDLGGDVWGCALVLDQLAHRVGVVGAIGQDDAAFRQPGEQRLRRPAVGGLARRQEEGERTALTVCKGVELGVASASRGADGLGESPPLPPAAERCAFT